MSRLNKRQRVEKDLLAGLSIREVAEKNRVSLAYVYQIRSSSPGILQAELGFLLDKLFTGIDFNTLTSKQRLEFYLKVLELKAKIEGANRLEEDLVIRIVKPDV